VIYMLSSRNTYVSPTVNGFWKKSGAQGISVSDSDLPRRVEAISRSLRWLHVLNPNGGKVCSFVQSIEYSREMRDVIPDFNSLSS